MPKNMNLKENILQKLFLHRRGIMGTVIFHLLLAILLLSMSLSNVNVHQELEIVYEAPEPEEIQKKLEEELQKEEIRKKTSDEEVEKLLRSVVSNENAKDKKRSRDANVQKYIDEVMDDLNKGSDSYGNRYKAQKDKNYRKDSLQHARDRKAQELDSLKSTFYSGESSVSYNLKDRYARFLPIPVFKCEFGGKVVVKIAVNRKGIVQKAEIVEGQSNSDDCLRDVAVDASLRARFNEKPDAPALQTGTITFNFVKQ